MSFIYHKLQILGICHRGTSDLEGIEPILATIDFVTVCTLLSRQTAAVKPSGGDSTNRCLFNASGSISPKRFNTNAAAQLLHTCD